MEDSGRKSGFVSSITQEQFLLLSKPRLKLFTGWVRERLGECWEKLSLTQVCSNTEGVASPEVLDEGGQGGIGGMKNRRAGCKAKTSDRRAKTSVSQKEWGKVQPDFWGAAEAESRATLCCSDRESPEVLQLEGIWWGSYTKREESWQPKKERQYLEKVHQGRNELGFSAQGSSSG